ncbi:nicotinate-nucleotide--dimethylbenzimidazole phosphoribosyltransferase [Streptomyces sp. NPDC047928]|uniref:nicotinate-nucleotide--dimethylbenzimidazole phosphoribosyltransferase n=1 Tax=unclassified Streptomyces TaxID=2593676 RepID=UPI00371AF915
MTDTGQVPGEGQPEAAGMVEQPGMPAPGAYAFLDPSENTAEDDDLLLMPGTQGAWTEPHTGAVPVSPAPPAPAAAPAAPTAPAAQVPAPEPAAVAGQAAQPVVPAQGVPVAAPAPVAEQPQPGYEPVAQEQPAPEQFAPEQFAPAYEAGVHETGAHEAGGRDSGSVDLGAVRIPPPAQTAQTPPSSRRPLHMGPPMPDATGGVVRSLADRGPAGAPAPAPVRQPAPAQAGPEYLDAPREEPAPVLPGPQLAEIPPQGAQPWSAQPPAYSQPMEQPMQQLMQQSHEAHQPQDHQGQPPASAETVVPPTAIPAPTAPAPAQAQAQAPAPAAHFVPVEGSVPTTPHLAPTPVAVPVAPEQTAAEPTAPEPTAPEQAGTAGPEAPVAAEPEPVAAAPEPSPEAMAPVAPVAPEPAPEPEAAPVPEPAPAPEAAPVAQNEPAAEPVAEPEPVADQAPETAPVPEVAPVPETAPVPEAVPAPEAAVTVPAPRDGAADPAQPVDPAAPEAARSAPEPEEQAQEAETAQVIETPEIVEPAPEAQTQAAQATEDPITEAPAEATPQAPAEATTEAPAEATAPASGEATAPASGEDAAAPAPAEDAATDSAGPADASAEAPVETDAGAPSAPAPGYADAEREAVLRVMRERRDIRNGFRGDPIPHEVLLRVLEAAHTAPSVGHSQPWDFVVIRSAETRRTMHELAQRQREAYAKSLPKGRAKQFKELKIEAILDTPVNIVVTADPTRGGRHTLGRHTQPQMAPYSSALAVENLWLAARAEGLGVGWVSFFDEREMVRALGLPEHLEVVAYLCVGYVDEFPEEPELMQAGWSKRRPLAWVVHEETYGRRALPGEDPHDLLQETVANIRPLDAKALGEAWERQKRMTKPAGALGMLEIISAQLSGLSRMCPPPIPEPAAVAIFAGDHGVHAQGVTAWPQEVTAQMVANFLGGGAVCNAFANQVGAEVCVIDVGVAGDLPATPGLLPRKVRPGTSDFTTGPALTREEVHSAVEVGIETARDLVSAGNKALLTGEMGIANTTASAALISVYTGVDPAEVTGRGTGINDEMHARKVDVVRRALELHQPDPADPIGVLAAIGGLEHAAMVGFILGGASLRTPVILDGVSAGAAALVARAVAPEALAACVAGHRSAEPGHVAALNKLGLRPLVDLDLRLGEGTGALLALPLVQSAARAMHEVATFDSAGVTEK